MIRFLANSKYSKFVSSALAFIIFFNNVIFPTRTFALTGGPSQAEFSSFEPASSSEMVNLFTGDFSYNIPLMDVDGYPVNIAYHASPSMDQEASWVGLGWNLNVGAINRNMRGLPDDFNGDPVNRQLKIEPYKAWGVSMGYFGELAGLKMPISANGSAGVGVFHSNYKGWGVELDNSNSVGMAAGKHMQGGLTAGLGMKINSQDGVDIYPQLGISGKLGSEKKSATLGLNIGCTINSREGLTNVYGGYTISGGSSNSTSKNSKSSADGYQTNKSNGVGFGIGSSATVPASSQGYMPAMVANMSSQAYSLDFKLGANACIYAQGGYVSGYYVQSGINDSQKNKDFNAYGYMFSHNATDNDLFDFNRDKDGMMYPETPNLPISNYTYDVFAANAQGMMYAFRPQRNDVGILRDNHTIDNSFGIGLGAELMLSSDVNVGINANVMFAKGHAGRWTNDNDFNLNSDFSKEHYSGTADYSEPAYFKVAGEKTVSTATFAPQVTNAPDDAYRASLSQVTNQRYKVDSKLVDKYGNPSIISAGLVDDLRARRNNLVSYLNAQEASQFALSTQIESYQDLTSAAFTAGNFNDKLIQTSSSAASPGEFVSGSITTWARNGSYCGNRVHHLSEMTVTQDNGSRYVYGIPLYNRQQTDAIFNVEKDPANNVLRNDYGSLGITKGLTTYGASDDDIYNSGNSQGIDHFVEKRTLPDYSHGFLLTSVLSADYVDRSGNGPTKDDYGDYTKFNYTRVAGEESAYKWRIPMSGDARQANFVQGFLGDVKDNKGTYIYGKKDLWYLQSIETKNYLAFFVLNDNGITGEKRQDAYEPVDDEGGIASTPKARYLKEIRLYAKKDLAHGGIASASPIKVVNFEYDYSLCPGTPNSKATGGGKLTLKKIWFTYGLSQKGQLSPYQFDYADINHDGTVDGDENPSYNQAAVDRWGYYQLNSGASDNNLDFPYTKQGHSYDQLNKNAAAWSLTQIKTPAGSTIKVNYEADDYAYVQATSAGQMFQVAGTGNTATPTTFSGIDLNSDYIYLDLTASKDQGIRSGTASPDQVFVSKYLKNLTRIYFRFKVNLDNTYNEFVPGYADIESSGIISGTTYNYPTSGGVAYYKYAYIKIKKVGLNDKNMGASISPMMKAAFQMGRMYLPQVVFPGSQPSSGNGTAIQGLVTSIKDARTILKGINKALLDRGIAKTFEPGSSVVRLYNPGGKKTGGGSRVSQITISDGWNGMSGENDATYGQQYDYTIQEQGNTVSSGVASYEPLQGGDEISMRYPLDFSVKHTLAPNDEYFQEEPMGEAFFPDPLVGYRKVSVKNLTRKDGSGNQIVNAHATGHTEYEFYTAKDFPVVTDRTDLQKERVKPKLLMSILKFGSTDKLYMSQGYVIKTNDMHGKPKSQKMFAEGETIPLSGVIYHYKSKAGLKSPELDNTVDVIDKSNTITSKTIGKTMDFYSDSREAVNDVYNAGISININSATCTEYVPLVFVWPSFGHEHREFHSMGTTKLIQQYGLIDYVEAFENHSNVITKNLLYDDLTGEVLLTQTTNDFDDPVYNFKYPAYWAYGRMGGGFENTGIKFKASIINSSGKITANTAMFRPGDEVAIIDPNPSDNYSKKAWVIEDQTASPGDLYLVDRDGHAITSIPNTTGSPAFTYLKIIRSGNRNMQSLPMASMLSLTTPVNSGHTAISVPTSSVVNSSAVEYSDHWQMLLGDKTGTTTCNCVNTAALDNLQQALYTIFDHNLNTSSSVLVYTKPSGSAPGNYIYPDLSPLLQSFPWFVTCEAYSLSSTHNVYLNITKSVSGSNHILNLQFTGLGGGCSGSSCNIQLVANNASSYVASGNFWDRTIPVRAFALNTSLTCPSANSFSVAGVDAPPAIDPEAANPLFYITGTGCYDLTSCTSTSNLAQCGRVVGDIVNPYVENIRGAWRVNKSYSYLADRSQTNQSSANMNGDIRKDGVYTAFKPFWSYGSSAWLPVYNPSRTDYVSASPYDKWIKNNEVEKVNAYGNVVQAADVLGRRSASLYGYNHTLPVAAANNSYYNQLAFDGFEDYVYVDNECSASLTAGTTATDNSGYIEHFSYYPYKINLVNTQSHTGRYSINVPAQKSLTITRPLTNPTCSGATDDAAYTLKDCDRLGLFGPFYSYSQPQKFVVSAWAKEVILLNNTPLTGYPHPSVAVSVNGSLLTTGSPKTTAIINGWQKLDYEFTVPASTASGNIAVTLHNSGRNQVYFDDIRIHPFNASMKSMVYDPYSLRLMAELDDRNFATIYEYDEEGTLVRIKKETEKGIYTIKESRSGIKK